MHSDITSHQGPTILLILSLFIHLFLLIIFFSFHDTSHESFMSIAQEEALPTQPDQDEMIIEILPQGIQPNNSITQEDDEPPQLMMPAPETSSEQSQEPDQEEIKKEDHELEESREEQHAPLPIPLPAQEPDMITPVQKKVVKKIAKMMPRPQPQPAQRQQLTQLVQGYLQHAQNERGSISSPSHDAQQLARQHYMTKMWNALKVAINTENNTISVRNNVDTHGIFRFTIAKDGRLLHASLDHPQKDFDIAALEHMLVRNAQKVGLFPPLPDCFQQDRMVFSMPIHLHAQQGIRDGYRISLENK